MADVFEIRQASVHDIPLLNEWARLEHWNPGHVDIEAFCATDPTGFFLGTLNGVPIASVSGVKHDSSYGFLGYYIVKPEYRGKGYGLRLFRKALEYLNGRNIGLDGVAEQQANYAASGFKLAYDQLRLQGPGTRNLDARLVGWFGNIEVKEAKQVSFEELLAYDTAHFGYERRPFLTAWLSLSRNHSFCVYEEGVIKGFGCIRPSDSGYRIGPLYAETKEIASTLLSVLRNTVYEQFSIDIDVPGTNSLALELLRDELGFKEIARLGRMYTQAPPVVPLNEVYGIATLELG